MKPIAAKDRLIVAIDTPDAQKILRLTNALAPHVGAFKFGLEVITAFLAEYAIQRVVGDKGHVFYDGKFHDIPNTIAGAVRPAVARGVLMLNMHVESGRAAMEAAVKARDEVWATQDRSGQRKPLLIGVTVLTSLKYKDLFETGTLPELPLILGPDEQVKAVKEKAEHDAVNGLVVKRALLAKKCGLDGVVCSPQDIVNVKQTCGDDFCTVVPGIRPIGADAGDQARRGTPAEAERDGAHYQVVGRPITEAKDPVAAALKIIEEIESASVAV